MGKGHRYSFYSTHQKKENDYQVFKLINGLVSVWMVQWTDKAKFGLFRE